MLQWETGDGYSDFRYRAVSGEREYRSHTT